MPAHDTTTTTRVCRTCKTELPIEAFGKESRRVDGIALTCKRCKHEINVRNRIRRNEACYHCKRTDPPEGFARSGYCRPCEKERMARYYTRHAEERRSLSRAYYKANRARCRARDKAYRLAIRKEALEAYGGSCACCGETRIEFLAIDHERGDGTEHRARSGAQNGGTQFFYWLKKRGFPQDEGLRVLCHNCNMAIGFYGYCPHVHQALVTESS